MVQGARVDFSKKTSHHLEEIMYKLAQRGVKLNDEIINGFHELMMACYVDGCVFAEKTMNRLWFERLLPAGSVKH